jgi:hypothetical protein
MDFLKVDHGLKKHMCRYRLPHEQGEDGVLADVLGRDERVPVSRIVDPGADLINQFSAIFAHFRRRKLAFYKI